MSTKASKCPPGAENSFHLFHLFVCRDQKSIYICTPFEKRNDGTSNGVLYKIAQRQAGKWLEGLNGRPGRIKKANS